MLKNNLLMNDLFAWYGHLLTERQQQIMAIYYQEDLSLAEIAENKSISRSAVHDIIRRSEDNLIEYEEKLKIVQKFHARSELYEELKALNIDAVDKIVLKLEEIE